MPSPSTWLCESAGFLAIPAFNHAHRRALANAIALGALQQRGAAPRYTFPARSFTVLTFE
jgi:hypothetical protein